MWFAPREIVPVPPDPPARNPPIVEFIVDGYIQSCWPLSRAACSSCDIGAPASAVMNPSPTSSTFRAREVSSTRPPREGIDWP